MMDPHLPMQEIKRDDDPTDKLERGDALHKLSSVGYVPFTGNGWPLEKIENC